MRRHRYLLKYEGTTWCHHTITETKDSVVLDAWFRDTSIRDTELYLMWSEPLLLHVVKTGKPWVYKWYFYAEDKHGKNIFAPKV